jgi:hypothetical protein
MVRFGLVASLGNAGIFAGSVRVRVRENATSSDGS